MSTDVQTDTALFELALRMGDNTLILGQQVSAWCGHAPILEEDIALANTALDLIGQTKLWLALAGEIEGKGRSADDLAFLRDARAFRNVLLVEQPNGDFGQTLMRQYLFDAWHLPMLTALKNSIETRVADIAEKSAKEAAYHLERSEDLIIRLGDGSDESHTRMQNALDALWPFAGELTQPDAIDDELAQRGLAPDLADIKTRHEERMRAALKEATLQVPEAAIRKGGKQGMHSEGLGYLLSDMQWLQRAYPGAEW
ncbi:phenylacetate-CoA oxygenase subunit PaaC [Hyphococcus flavus]|uniref:Phenylacetate-CoA oxygenase subunit PaaC n=1 Tax=Hyphococcus flavus TaxID=1866326 RepID=A0AAF0CBD4_9PROT|nr:1,2-phenylacetyl-CoA epoxidase subunit PaaC [Hyphococcus flavus]WDI30685.1 phenylacetate-CoA oxygenase subunit PaaC [Hyphococcus flavus]